MASISGGPGNDSLLGTSAADSIFGLGGDDTILDNLGGNDTGFGGAGNDTIALEDGADTGVGGEGNDAILGLDGADVLHGDEGAGYALTGLAGQDILGGEGGSDTLYGGAERDEMYGGFTPLDAQQLGDEDDAGDLMYGGSGDDVMYGIVGDDIQFGGDGDDRIEGGAGNDVLHGEAGNDFLVGDEGGGAGDDTAYGGDGNDQLHLEGGNNAAYGGVGNDFVTAGAGNDFIDAGAGDDTVAAGDGANIAYGGAGNDGLTFGAGADTVYGGDGHDNYTSSGAGADTFHGEAGDDFAFMGTGNDVFYGGDNLDVVFSSIGRDLLYGGTGDDELVGEADSDTIYGGLGNDQIEGGQQADTMFGGGGNDTFYGGDPGFNGGRDGVTDTVDYRDAVGVSIGIAVNFATGVVTGDAALIGTDTLHQVEAVMGTSLADSFDSTGLTPGHPNAGDFSGYQLVRGGDGNDIINGNFNTEAVYFDATGAVVGVMSAFGTGTVTGNSVGTDTLTGVNRLIGGLFNDTFTGSNNTTNTTEVFDGSIGGDDTVFGGGGFDVVEYDGAAFNAIDVDLAAGLITGRSVGSNIGTDVLNGVEGVRGSELDDVFDATGFGPGSANPSSTGQFNQFQGQGGSDTVIGNGFTQINFGAAAGGVQVVFTGVGEGTATATYNSNVATDTFSGVNNVNGAGGADTMIGSSAGDTLYGGNGDDTLDGADGSDQVFGGAGNDVINGGVGNDYMVAGSGNDTIDGGLLFDFAAEGNERLDVDTVDYSNIGATGGIVAHLFDGTITGNASIGIDVVSGVEGVRGTQFDDHLVGGGGARFEAFRGGGGDDVIAGDGVHGTRAEYVDATGSVLIMLSGGDFGEGTAFGGAAGVGTDSLFNVNQFQGSNFADTLLAASYDLVLVEDNSAFNAFRGGDGADMVVGNGVTRLEYGNSTASVIVNLAAGTASDGFGDIDVFSGVNAVVGGSAADTFYGGASSFDNMDYEGFRGNAGDDLIYGGDGEDEARYDQSSDPIGTGITVNMVAGTLIGDPTWTGTDTLFSIERIVGSAQSDYYDARGFDTGNAINTFRSGALPSLTFNAFTGGAGDDTIFGNGDTAVIFRGATAAVVGGFASMGAGTVSGSGNIGTDTFLEGVFALVDTNFNDTFYGSDVDDDDGDYIEVFSLFRGDDVVYGGAGDDVVAYNTAIKGGIHADLANGTVLGLATGADLPWSTGLDRLYGVENVIATQFVDTLVGDAGDNGFAGLEGADTIDGGPGGFDNAYYFFDIAGVQVNLTTGTAIDGWGDLDTLLSINAATGSQFADILTGNAGDNELSGAAGNDTIEGLAANDQIQGEDGNDSLFGGDGNDTLDPGLGVDTVNGGAGADTIFIDCSGLADAVNMFGTGTTGTVVAGVNTVNFTAIEVRDVTGGSGDDALRGGALGDTFDGGAGNDQLFGLDDVDTLIGGDGNDRLFGGNGTDILRGGEGADSLDGGAELDTMIGGGGNDVYIVDHVGDVLNETAPGSGGFDIALVSVNGYTVGEGVERANLQIAAGQTITGAGNTDNGFYGGVGNDVMYGGGGNDSAVGGTGADRLFGDADDDRLFGGADNDVLYGGTGNDVLDGGTGNDAMFGGAGDDTYTVDSLGDIANETAPGSGGVDTLNLSVAGFAVNTGIEVINVLGLAGMTITGGGATDNQIYGGLGDDRLNGGVGTGVDLLYGGAAQDRLFGGAGDDSLFGGAGMDSLLGEAGADFMAGGASNDVYFVDDAGDVVDETSAGSGGYDLVFVSTADYTIGEGVDRANMQLAGGGQIVAVGAGNNTLSGNVGDDTFYGGDGDDLLNGVAGADSLFGGAGNDKLYGGEGGDLLEGGDGNDTIDGGVGGDQMAGGAGNDIYFANDVGDDIDEHSPGSDGFDIVFVNTATYEVDEGVERINVQFAAGISLQVAGETDNLVFGGAGNDALNAGGGIDTLVGGNGDDALGGGTGNDRLDGGAGSDSLDGGDGDDVLLGGAGSDSMSGGAGNDTYYMNQSTDVAGELAPGSDGVDLALVYQTGTNVGEGIERITVQGAVGLFVSAGGNTDNTMTGGAGGDILAGGAGNDTAFGLNGNDVLLGGSDNDLLDGGAGNDSLDGGDGLDVLLGAAGNDTLNGGLGADTLTGGAGVDRFEKHANQGNDTIADFGLGGADKVDLTGITVTSPFGAATVTFSDGTTLTAANGHLWIAADFV